jgi:hypothetical protein
MYSHLDVASMIVKGASALIEFGPLVTVTLVMYGVYYLMALMSSLFRD